MKDTGNRWRVRRLNAATAVQTIGGRLWSVERAHWDRWHVVRRYATHSEAMAAAQWLARGRRGPLRHRR